MILNRNFSLRFGSVNRFESIRDFPIFNDHPSRKQTLNFISNTFSELPCGIRHKPPSKAGIVSSHFPKGSFLKKNSSRFHESNTISNMQHQEAEMNLRLTTTVIDTTFDLFQRSTFSRYHKLQQSVATDSRYYASDTSHPSTSRHPLHTLTIVRMLSRPINRNSSDHNSLALSDMLITKSTKNGEWVCSKGPISK